MTPPLDFRIAETARTARLCARLCAEPHFRAILQFLSGLDALPRTYATATRVPG